MQDRIAVVGLGYVGLPLAVALAEHGHAVIAYDVDPKRIAALQANRDATGQVQPDELAAAAGRLTFSSDPAAVADASAIAITVPTPIGPGRQPDLGILRRCCTDIGPHLARGTLVILESTVFPGVTEDYVGPWLAASSGLHAGEDFVLAYSPERVNPGDTQHGLKRIAKVLAAQDAETLDRARAIYEPVIEAGLHIAPSIQTAEAAKVIENTQRDLNIALMNELALIFDRLDLRTADVLAAAGSKWNFLPFKPGLVGGHCIGVDPYYLTAKAESVGYQPDVILAGRRVNDGMGAYIGRQVAQHIASSGARPVAARVGVLGLAFKEDVPDIRNSRVPDILEELAGFGIQALLHDPYADPTEAEAEYGLALQPMSALTDLDALILAVPHSPFSRDGGALGALVRPGGLLCDVKSVVAPADVPDHCRYWSL